MPTLKELAVQFAKKQPKQVDYVTEDAPILARIPFEEASHDLWNVYEEITDVTGASFVDLDAELPTVSVNSQLKKADLSILGGKIYCGEDKANLFGGAPNYFAKNERAILKKSGQSAEYAILYNMMRAHAVANGKKINSLNNTSSNYSILAVRFVPGETTGLYSPKAFVNGTLLDVKALNGGALTEFTVTRNGVTEKVVGYGVRYKSYVGFQIANLNSVAGIFNIDASFGAGKKPTAAMIDDLLDLVRADNSNTFLFMHPKVKTYGINPLKPAGGQVAAPGKSMQTVVNDWNGVPIITSYNFLNGTEALVSFS